MSLGGANFTDADIIERDVDVSAQMSRLIHHNLDLDVSPEDIERFFKHHWRKISALAHAIHAKNARG